MTCSSKHDNESWGTIKMRRSSRPEIGFTSSYGLIFLLPSDYSYTLNLNYLEKLQVLVTVHQ